MYCGIPGGHYCNTKALAFCLISLYDAAIVHAQPYYLALDVATVAELTTMVIHNGDV